MAFAELKRYNIPAEFIPEQARFHIAEQRFHQKLPPEAQLKLTDDDQKIIMQKQLLLEEIMTAACGPSSIIICDSSALNTLMYMTEEYLQRDDVKALKNQAIQRYDVVYYSAPIVKQSSFDPNRIHDQEFSQAFDKRIPSFCSNHFPDLHFAKTLSGTPAQRQETMMHDLMERILR